MYPKGIFSLCWRLTEEMIKMLEPAIGLLEKYKHPYDIVYTNFCKADWL